MNPAARPFCAGLALVLAAACQGTSTLTPSPQVPTASPTVSQTPMPTSSPVPSAEPQLSPTLPPTPGPTFTATPSPSVQSTPTPTALPTEEPAGLVVDWRYRGEAPGFGRLFDDSETPTLHSGTVFAGRHFIAGAQQDPVLNDQGENDEIPAIWSSADGMAWEMASLPGLGEVYAMAANQAGLVVAAAASAGNTGLWLTTDGSDWEPVMFTDLVDQWIYRMGATDQGFVGFGSGAWTSSDGLDWQPLTTESALAMLDQGVLSVESYGDLVVVLSPTPGGGPLVAWTSTNLVDWNRVGPLRGSRRVNLPTINGGPLGWIVTGSYEDRSRTDLMWWSADGLTWQEVSQAIGPVSDVFIDRVGYVAVGFLYVSMGCDADPSEIQGQTWTSVDGRTWNQMPLEGFQYRRIDHLFEIGRTLIGIGLSYEEEVVGARGSVWTGSLPAIAPSGPGPVDQIPEPDPGGCGPG